MGKKANAAVPRPLVEHKLTFIIRPTLLCDKTVTILHLRKRVRVSVGRFDLAVEQYFESGSGRISFARFFHAVSIRICSVRQAWTRDTIIISI
jgi:hypothetical protein